MSSGWFLRAIGVNVDYQVWLPLLGLSAKDSRVVAALAAHGVDMPIKLGRQELTTSVDFKGDGMSLEFRSELVVRKGVADLPILCAIIMKPTLGKTDKKWTAYAGALPHGLQRTDDKDAVVALLGEPVAHDDDFCSGNWEFEGRKLGIMFVRPDWKGIRQLGLSLPDAS